MYEIGKVVNTHGLHGDVIVKQESDFSELFIEGETVYANVNNHVTALKIEKQRIHKQSHLIRFAGYNSIDEAERLKGLTLHVREHQLPELEEGYYHYYEIVDCEMYTVEGEKVGKITHILSPGANDVWVVENEQGKEILIPVINDVIDTVDIAEKKVIITPMEGLLD